MSDDRPHLKELRNQLDTVDGEIVRLIARRFDTVGEIIKAKAGKTQGIRDPQRERELLGRIEAIANSVGLSASLARKIFSEILSHSVIRQAATLSGAQGRELTVTIHGGRYTYNHLAAEKYTADLNARARFLPVGSIAESVEKLAAGEADLALVPIENTAAGSINQVYDILRERDVHIVGEEIFKFDHCLAAPADVPLSAIERVLSHPLALEQCSAFVAALGRAKPVPCVDSAEALRLVADAKDPTQAAIGSAEGAEAFGLTVLRRGIGNQEEILMRYVALARAPEPFDPRIPCKTSLILTARHEQGALLRCLQILSDYGLSLTKLESRPRPNRPWEYMFFIDFEGNVADERVISALDQLRAQSLFLKVLGCYPAKATPVAPQQTALAPTKEVPSPAVEQPAPRPVGPAPPGRSYKLVDRATRAEDTIVRVGDLLIGGDGFTVMAGPAVVTSEAQINTAAKFVREQGAHLLRGGVFESPHRPDGTQGLGPHGLELLVAAGRAAGLPIITEVMSPEQVRPVAERADVLQVGAANMQNFPLLLEVGKVDRPVLLERGLSSTIEEWLAAAEYILAQGNGQVILCERGIRTFESATRNTLDLSAVVALRERTHLPVVVDPSHGTGKRSYVAPMALAARACGAHGLLLDVNPATDDGDSDDDQSLTLPEFAVLMDGLGRLRV